MNEYWTNHVTAKIDVYINQINDINSKTIFGSFTFNQFLSLINVELYVTLSRIHGTHGTRKMVHTRCWWLVKEKWVRQRNCTHKIFHWFVHSTFICISRLCMNIFHEVSDSAHAKCYRAFEYIKRMGSQWWRMKQYSKL